MKHLFIPYNLALLAKSKGYPQNTGSNLGAWELKDGTEWFYTGAHPVGLLAAPLYQQIIDWFRERHIDVWVHCRIHSMDGKMKSWQYRVNDQVQLKSEWSEDIDDYYRCLNKAIEKAFKLTKTP